MHYNVPEEGKPKEKFGICVKGLTFPDVDLSLRISMLFVYNMKKSAIVANQFIVVKVMGSNLNPKHIGAVDVEVYSYCCFVSCGTFMYS